jgi:glycosyltransferase involved in cell wall biosynthesis
MGQFTMNKNYPLVSIVTPAYNQANYLKETIESVLAQKYPNIEYIVINDGSTDETSKILNEYSGKIISYSHENIGQAKTLNKGWVISSGVVLGYLSADDILLPGAVSKAVALLQSESNIVMVYPDCDLIDPFSRVIRHSVSRATNYEELVVEQECYIGPGAFFRRSAYEIAGGWDERLRVAPDREFWMRLGLLGRIVMIPEVLALYRMHPQSISFFHSTQEDAQEYPSVIGKYFGMMDIPASIISRKNEAFCRANIVGARIHLRGGRFFDAVRSIISARSYFKVPLIPVIIMLARTLVSRHIHRGVWGLKNLLPIFRRGKRQQ